MLYDFPVLARIQLFHVMTMHQIGPQHLPVVSWVILELMSFFFNSCLCYIYVYFNHTMILLPVEIADNQSDDSVLINSLVI